MKVKVKNDTLFKLQPVLSSELTDAEKVYVKNGTEYDVEFCGEAANDHLRLELANVSLARQRSFTWYVRKFDIDILGSGVTAKVVKDTLFKQRPVLSSDLSDREKVFVREGSEFAVQSQAPAEASYIKLTLADAGLGTDHLSTWYVSSSDVKIIGQRMTLRVIADTLFKAKPGLTSQLASTEKIFVPKGTTFEIHSYLETEGNYLRIALTSNYPETAGRMTWYAFAPDIEIEGTEPGNKPRDTNSVANLQSSDRGQPIQLPGFQGTFYIHQPIIAGGHFTWGEATHGGTRIPASSDVVYGMIRIAEVMEEVRAIFDNRSIQITSWYRDPATNLSVGGTTTSRHLKGDAVNFIVEGIHPHDVFSRLDAWWGARGGLASSTEFTHIDARGYRARWDYGF